MTQNRNALAANIARDWFVYLAAIVLALLCSLVVWSSVQSAGINRTATASAEASSPFDILGERIDDRFGLRPFEKRVFTEVNNQRLANKLVTNSELQAAAQDRVQHMIDNDYFSHNQEDGDTRWSDSIREAGYEYSEIGENIARGYASDHESLVEAWMDSTLHRENIVYDKFTETGIATGVDKDGETIIVQLFGSPKE